MLRLDQLLEEQSNERAVVKPLKFPRRKSKRIKQCALNTGGELRQTHEQRHSMDSYTWTHKV